MFRTKIFVLRMKAKKVLNNENAVLINKYEIDTINYF